MLDEFNKRGQEALTRAMIWAIIGSLYGMIFIFFYNLSQHWSLPLSPLFFSATLAATIAALIYSSMRLAVIVSLIASMVCLFYVVANGEQISLSSMMLVTAIAGAITGGIYGAKAKSSRVFRADAKTLAGVSSGALVAILIVIVSALIPAISLSIIIAVSCLLTGALYVTLVPFFVRRYHELLPPVGDGAMVGAGASVFIALLFFVLISGVTPEMAGPLQPLTEQIRNTFFGAALGGMLGGAISGFLSGMMLTRWQDL